MYATWEDCLVNGQNFRYIDIYILLLYHVELVLQYHASYTVAVLCRACGHNVMGQTE